MCDWTLHTMRISDTVIRQLTQAARESDVRSQHAAAILDKSGKIMAMASNYHFHKPINKSNWLPEGDYTMHAEEAVYQKFMRQYPHLIKLAKLKKNIAYILVVIRIQRGGEHCIHSKPCKKCTQKINKLIKLNIINRVYYSVNP